MFNYIHKYYPKLKKKASMIKTTNENMKGNLSWYKSLQNKFDCVCLHVDDNRNYHLISQLDKNKLEILVNEECFFNCPYRKQHYELFDSQKGNKKCFYKEKLTNINDFCYIKTNEFNNLRKLQITNYKEEISN